MADTKITSLQPPQAGYSVVPATDVLPIVVIADPGMATSGSTRKVTVNQLLGAGGTATLASATITGALTVDTTTLVVNPSGYADRVGIGTASPNGPLDVQANTAGTAISIRGRVSANVGTLRWFQNNGTTETAAIDSYDTGFEIRTLTAVPSIFITNSTERYRIASDGVATWSNVGGSSGTAMTLNATGLGVGTVPANGIKLASYVTTAGVPVTSGTTQSAGSLRIGAASTAGVMDMGTAGSYSWIQPCNATNLAINYDLVLNQNGGNVGIGVTNPTYKLQTTVASGANRNIFAAQIAGASNGFEVLWNHATTTLRIVLSNIPTSAAGLASGTLWIDTSAGNTLKVA